jgi:hypothetical protein
VMAWRAMTRRAFVRAAMTGATIGAGASARLIVPVHRVVDSWARVPPERLRHFWTSIWPEACRTFGSGGIDVQTEDAPGEVKRSPGDRPIFVGLRRGALNLVLTGHLPMYWDAGRSLAGVTTIYQGYHVCLVAMLYAHGNQVPYLATNTCVHELLHALLGDILVSHPKWYQVGERETRVDWYATQLWLFGDGAAVRRSARAYLERLRAEAAAQSAAAPPQRPIASISRPGGCWADPP